MRLVLDQEQEDLRALVREFLADQAPMTKVREVVDGKSGYDRELWRRMARDLGLTGLVIPEAYGGSGAGHVERSIVAEELGRALVPTPFLSSAVLMVDALLALDDVQAREELLPAVTVGDVVGTVAVSESCPSWHGETTTSARPDGDRWVLNGEKNLVIDGDIADVVLVYAITALGPGFFLVRGDADGLTRDPLVTLDATRPLARLSFSDTPARKLDSRDAAAAKSRIADLAAVALAAEQAGGLGRAMELAVDYAKVRVQFGRLIGSYQAVKHGCVDSYVDCELCTSVVRYAAWVADHRVDELPEAASLARAVVSPAYFGVAARTILLHGGIGYTWEYDAHLYYKRAKTSELLFGDPHEQRALLADRLGI